MAGPMSRIWVERYQIVKDPSWPEVNSQSEFLALPKEILQEVLFDHLWVEHNILPKSQLISWNDCIEKLLEDQDDECPVILAIDHDQQFRTNDITVFYHKSLAGGGTYLAKRYRDLLHKLYPNLRFENCFEWCSGPAFIGFDLLSNGLCQNLYLSDIFEPAIDSIKATIAKNSIRCEDRVNYHQAASVADLPSHWQFDLVVANPPMINTNAVSLLSQINKFKKERHRIAVDCDWKIHEDFFSNIVAHLQPNATILLAESVAASGPDSFRHMIEANNLYIENCYWEDHMQADVYFLEIKQVPTKDCSR